jgi:hypothetical protein
VGKGSRSHVEIWETLCFEPPPVKRFGDSYFRLTSLMAAVFQTFQIAFTQGHRRRVTLSQSSDQSVSSLSGGAESGIKRTVVHRCSAWASTWPRIRAGSGAPPPEEKNPTGGEYRF